jgi:hypothetical protein
MVVIAIGTGTLRQNWYGHYLSELRPHQLSTLTGVLLLGLYIWALTRLWRLESSVQALTIGFIWLGLTVGFEFLVGHYMIGHPWSRLLHEYNISAGRLWGAFLLWITVAPYVFYGLQP